MTRISLLLHETEGEAQGQVLKTMISGAVLGGFLGFPETPSISDFYKNCPLKLSLLK